MFVFLSIILFSTTVGLLLHARRTRQLLGELEEALSASRKLLVEGSDRSLKLHGVVGLIREANALIVRQQVDAAQNAGYVKQIEAIFQLVQGVVVIYNSERVVEFSNEFAERLLRNGQSIIGLRIESVLRSHSLLALLEAANAGGATESRQISVEHAGETLWFEASCAEVPGIASPQAVSTLLVLYDITRLQRLEDMRREFVANVSHELRTPLTSIKGFAEMLVEDAATLPPETHTRFLGKILSNAERLSLLVEDLLTLSRLESKPDQLDSQVQPLRALFVEIVEDYQARLNPQGQTIVLDFDECIGSFAYDRFRIRQVLDNLVANVFRYAPEFTRLNLGARYDEAQNRVVCSVGDDGPGIPEKDVPHLFERFYRVDKGRSHERGGTGLGLSIVKHIVQLHDGTLHAESQMGEGTKISFSLPHSGGEQGAGPAI